jgi:hypothetical protein
MADIDWRSKIEALLNKAQASGVTPEEAEAFTEKAAFLAAKYGIQDAQARQRHGKVEHPKYVEFRMFPPYKERKCDLLGAVAYYMGGGIARNRSLKVSSLVWVFGYPDDIERIKMLYHSLLAQMHIELASAIKPMGEHGKAYKNSWLIGFVKGVMESLERAKKRAMNETPGSDLILKKDFDKVLEAITDKFGNLKELSSSAEITSGSGYVDGRRAGLAADIGTSRLSSQNKAAIN